MNYFILDDDRRVIPVSDMLEFGRWFENMDNRRVGWTEFETVQVSTVFLGINHRYFGSGPPLLFETMVFGLNMENEAMTSRYSSWDDAETGHRATVRRVGELIAKAAVGA